MAQHATRLELEYDWRQLDLVTRKYSNILSRFLQVATSDAMELVANTAVSDFMRPASLESYQTGKTVAAQSKVLNIRTSRLMRSIKGSFAPSGGGGSEGGREGIRQVKTMGRGEIVGILGSRVPYARIHEYGGMAGRGRSVRIPARPYLRPALKKREGRIKDIYANRIQGALKESGLV